MAITKRTKLLLALATTLVVLVLGLGHAFSVDSWSLSILNTHTQEHGLEQWHSGESSEKHVEPGSEVVERTPPKQAGQHGSGGSAQAGIGAGGQAGSQGSENAGAQAPAQEQHNPAAAGQGANAPHGQAPAYAQVAGAPRPTNPEEVGRGLMNLMLLSVNEIEHRLGFNIQTARSTYSEFLWNNDQPGDVGDHGENLGHYVTAFFLKFGQKVPEGAFYRWTRLAYTQNRQQKKSELPMTVFRNVPPHADAIMSKDGVYGIFRELRAARDLLRSFQPHVKEDALVQPSRKALMSQAFRVILQLRHPKPWKHEFRRIQLNAYTSRFFTAFTQNGRAATAIPGSSMKQMKYEVGTQGFFRLLGVPEAYETAMTCIALSSRFSKDRVDVGRRVSRYYIERITLFTGHDHAGKVNEAWLEIIHEEHGSKDWAQLLPKIEDSDPQGYPKMLRGLQKIRELEAPWLDQQPASRGIDPPAIPQLGAKVPPSSAGSPADAGTGQESHQESPSGQESASDEVDWAQWIDEEQLSRSSGSQPTQQNTRPAPDDGDPGPSGKRPKIGDDSAGFGT